jgi:hypothetical protein
METIPVISLGAAAFWIALAAVLIAGGWHKVRREQIKQETLLRLIEKTGRLDEELVKAIFPPPPPTPWPPSWHRPPDPTEGRRQMQGFGVVMTAVGVGLAVLATVLKLFGDAPKQEAAIVWFGIASVVVMFGLGMFVASKFATGPAPRDEHD